MSALEVIELDPSKAPMLPYAPAVRVPAAAEHLFLSGAVAADDDEYADDIVEQVRRVMRRHTAALEANGLGWSDVIHVYELLTDMRDTVPVHVTMAEFFDDPSWKPANTLIGIDALARPGARFELDVVAARAPRDADPAGSAFWMSGATAIPLYHMHPHIPEECVLPDDIVEQTRRVLATFDEVLAFTGSAWSDVRKGNLFLTDLRDLEAVRETIADRLGAVPPPLSLVGINALSAAGARLELEVVVGPATAAAGGPPAAAPSGADGLPAVLTPAGGRLVFLPAVAAGRESVPAGIAPQTERTLDAVAALLAERGLDWRAVAKVLVHVADARDADHVTAALASRCGAWRPAVTVVQVDDLPVPGGRVQLDVVAAG
jgi:2-iminobutanoate/2-iminopropanoate deaminase/2-aminomuconate deaminase